MAKPYVFTAIEVLNLFKNNTITVEEYTSSLLKHIKERDSVVKAWAYLDPAFVLNQARALDKIPQDQRGPLHGLAVGIKDTMNTKDMPTQFGSPIYQGHQPGFDSSAVAILRAAGALIFGSKTTTSEFTVTNSEPNTTNPHDPNRTPGGSSCGSAALLADVFSLKGDEVPKDIPLEEVSVALIKTPMWPLAGPGTIAAMEKAAAILRNSGAQVEEISFPSEVGDLETLQRIQQIILDGEARAAFLREYRVNKMNLAPEICSIVENTYSNYTHTERTEAIDTYASMRHVINNLADNYSFILTPSAVDEAPLGLDDMGNAAFNTPWTGFHMPAINVPGFYGAHSMPISLSLVASKFHDHHLLKMSKVFSELMDKGTLKE
ncbi:amidase signature domain-containing protein [Annulohypoxylon bovei var. microspora]|nr:amidase signature domain-containing protein [Annulohypoxylon bovei var. microspora]